MIIRFLLSLCWISLAWAGAEPPNAKDFDVWQKNRMEIQSKFSVLQAKLSKDTTKIVDEDQREALAFFGSLSQFKKDFSTSFFAATSPSCYYTIIIAGIKMISRLDILPLAFPRSSLYKL